MKTPLTLHLNPSHLVVPVGTIYCVTVEHNERLGVSLCVAGDTFTLLCAVAQRRQR